MTRQNKLGIDAALDSELAGKEPLANINVKAPRSHRKHWMLKARQEDTTLSEVIREFLEKIWIAEWGRAILKFLSVAEQMRSLSKLLCEGEPGTFQSFSRTVAARGLGAF